jgi:acyl-coenzyme A synthetase/AMP-(fatty) acid ligase
VEAGRGEKVALRWQGEPAGETAVLTYSELLAEVSRCSNLLERLGVKAGDRVMIYMSLTPSVVVAMLACARIGAIHSVVFSAFSIEALRSRIADCGASFVITADIGMHAGKRVELKQKVDEALAGGLVRSVHAPDDLLPAARALALEIAENTAPVSVAMTRQMLWRMAGEAGPWTAHRLDSAAVYARGRSGDAKEGVVSFLEKRAPVYPDKVSRDMPDFFPWWKQEHFRQ